MGFLFWVPAFAFVTMSIIERPVLQVFHFVLLPYITHDYLLKWHHDKKNGLIDSDDENDYQLVSKRTKSYQSVGFENLD